MAKLHSLGLYEPSALPYLVSEGILPQDSQPSSYVYTQDLCLVKGGQEVVEEVLRVDRCVVWSRSATIRRVFNLDIEGEAILHAFPASFPSVSLNEDTAANPDAGHESIDLQDPALVVILKTQAHIFCLSGATHVIPLAFEVARALPSSIGCILQPTDSTRSTLSSHTGNTFLGQNASTATSRASFLFEGSHVVPPTVSRSTRKVPTYCITDLLSDMGLVAATQSRNPANLEDSPLLSSDEQVIYISTDSHTASLGLSHHHKICIAVSLNRTTSSFTIWQAEARNRSRLTERTSGTNYRNRHSSNVHERQRIPSGRGPSEATRESLGGLMQSFAETQTKPQEASLSNIATLAAELGQDFETSGVQTRSARRISSMLARTDLAPANDRSTFNDNLANASRKSLSRTIRKEGSFGSFTERNSFGGRRSFPATTSIVSNATSFLEPGSRLSLNDTLGGVAQEHLDLAPFSDKLEKDITFMKLKSFLCHETSATADQASFRVTLIPHPTLLNSDGPQQWQLSVCIQESKARILTVVTVAVKSQDNVRKHRPELKAIQIQKGTNIQDSCLISDGGVSRLVVLTKTSKGDDVLHLEAPWSPSFRLDLPPHYHVYRIDEIAQQATTPRKHDAGIRRVIDGSQVQIAGILTAFNMTNFTLVDTEGHRHHISIDLRPSDRLAQRVLQVCRFILPGQLQDSLLVAFWEVSRWLENQNIPDKHQRTSIAIALFTLAVPFTSGPLTKTSSPAKRKKNISFRSSSGTLPSDISSWKSMQSAEATRSTPAWSASSSWAWTDVDLGVPTLTPKIKSPSKHFSSTSADLSNETSSEFSVSRCIDLTREFLQSPAGESMSGTEGYLPTAVNQDRNIRRTALASVIVGLHRLLEELRLEMFTDESQTNVHSTLCVIIAQLSIWMNWPDCSAAALVQLQGPASELGLFDRSKIDILDVPSQPFVPLSIFEFVEAALLGAPKKYHTLVDLVQNSDRLAPDHSLKMESMRVLPLTSAVVSMLESKSTQSIRQQAAPIVGSVDHMSELVLWTCERALESSTRLRQVLVGSHRDSPAHVKSSRKIGASNSTQIIGHVSHLATRDVRTISNQALDTESLFRWDVSSELDRQIVTKLVFNHDRRFQEASKLVNQARAPEIEYEPQPNWTEADALEAQKLLTQYATRRTFAVVAGRGMMHFNARMPLLTELVPRAQFSLQCILRPKTDAEGAQSMTFSADRSQFTEDRVCWAFFHNGASAGLMISKEADFIDTSWILYNKPSELTNRHAGFLLALGLNGHLKNLAKWVAFKYLTPKHTMTSVGLLLGLAASYQGTADTLITRLLSVHVTCLLPPGAAELNLSPLTQTTGIIGIGLLYHDSQHRRMSEVMLSEIESKEIEERSGDEPILRDEGYRLAAGMSLGLINLGHGMRLHGLHDMRVVERLLSVGVGTKNVNLVHVLGRATAGAIIAVAFIFMKTNDASIARNVDVPDTLHQIDYVRPDIFLLRTLARHLIMWDKIKPTADFIQRNLPQQYHHRADLKGVKRLATNDLPYYHVVAGICFAIALRFAGSQREDARDLLVSYLDQFLRMSRLSAINYDAKVTLAGIRNCLDILALSCATVMAGSGDLTVYRRLRALHGRIDKETPFGSHLAAHMAIGALFLSGGTATFGTSNLAVAALVIAFYPLFPTDVLDNRGHLQALRHLWVLAVEHRCLIARDHDSGQILSNVVAEVELEDGTKITLHMPGLLPELDTVKTISISTDNHWPVKKNLDSPASEQDLNTLNNKSEFPTATTPTIRDVYKSSSSGIILTLHHRALYDKPNTDVFEAELQALDQARGAPVNNTSTAAAGVPSTSSQANQETNPLEWVFSLNAFAHLDHAERALVLDGNTASASASDSSSNIDTSTANNLTKPKSHLLATTPVDTALSLDIGTLGPQQGIPDDAKKPLKVDKLWQIRVLLAWADRVEREEERQIVSEQTGGEGRGGTGDRSWLRKEVIEKLRWRVWKIGGGGKNEKEMG